MKRKLALFMAVLMLLGASAASAQVSIAHVVMGALESVKMMDLSREKLTITRADTDEVLHPDEEFLGLLTANLRVAKLINSLEYNPGSMGAFDAFELLQRMSESGSVDMSAAPFDIAGYVIYHVILPLQLEPVIRELPKYYDAVVSVKDWQGKLDSIMEMDSLNGGKIFHLAGFPKVRKAPEYAAPMYISHVDDEVYLYEMDSSLEGWMYSFWMRRHFLGNMNTVKMVVDWLNEKLDEVENAVG
ncbi:MAG: hypothetical protein GX843_09325 [Synergistaceae bacterium]|nr:hypothetical protein [Synergistaceae bacterium]